MIEPPILHSLRFHLIFFIFLRFFFIFIFCFTPIDQDGRRGRWKQQHQHTTFKSSYFLGIIIERVQKQHIMTS